MASCTRDPEEYSLQVVLYYATIVDSVSFLIQSVRKDLLVSLSSENLNVPVCPIQLQAENVKVLKQGLNVRTNQTMAY